MDFSSIVIMEKDEESGILTKELGSYNVEDGAEYINRAFCEKGIVHIYFGTINDVEDWEYSAIYDNFDEEIFSGEGFDMEFLDDEFNPTWLVKFEFNDDYDKMQQKITDLCKLIKEEMERTMDTIKEKEEEYK